MSGNMRGRINSVQPLLTVRLKSHTPDPFSFESEWEWADGNVQGKSSESVINTVAQSTIIDLEEYVDLYTSKNLLADYDDFDYANTPRLVYIPSADTLSVDRTKQGWSEVVDDFYSGWFFTVDVRNTFTQYKGGGYNKVSLAALSGKAGLYEIGYARGFLYWYYNNVGNPLVEHPQPSAITELEIAANNLQYTTKTLVIPTGE
jgi:hypothetical protein